MIRLYEYVVTRNYIYVVVYSMKHLIPAAALLDFSIRPDP